MFLLVTLTYVLRPVIWLLPLFLAFQFCYCWNWHTSYLQSVTYPVDVQCHRITDMSSQFLHSTKCWFLSSLLDLWTYLTLLYAMFLLWVVFHFYRLSSMTLFCQYVQHLTLQIWLSQVLCNRLCHCTELPSFWLLVNLARPQAYGFNVLCLH